MSELLNRKHFPIIEHRYDENASPSNYLFDPRKHLAADDYRNRNRHPWSEEDIRKLLLEEVGSLSVRAEKNFLLLSEYSSDDAVEKMSNDLYIPTELLSCNWDIGRVIDIGPEAFYRPYFPGGATATYNDWVMYVRTDTYRMKIANKTYLFVPDKSIVTSVESPQALFEMSYTYKQNKDITPNSRPII